MIGNLGAYEYRISKQCNLLGKCVLPLYFTQDAGKVFIAYLSITMLENELMNSLFLKYIF